MLDSGSLLSVPLRQLSSLRYQQAFDRLVRQCAAAPACARSYRPAADLAAILARLHVHPVQVTRRRHHAERAAGPGTRHWILANAASSSCLLAAATTFIKAGQPGRPEPWNACTRAMPREPVPFPAP